MDWQYIISHDPDAHPISREEEQRLFRLARNGDIQAENKLIKSQWQLVWKLAKSYFWTRIDLEELIDIAMVGLAEAYQKFDYTLEVRFCTFAVMIIKQTLSEMAPRLMVCVSIPSGYFNDRYRKQRKMTNDEWDIILNKFKLSASNDRQSGYHKSVDHSQSPEVESHQRDIVDIVRTSLECVTARHKRVLELRLDGVNLEDIGKELGVTKERARQIEKEGRERIRRWFEKNKPNMVKELQQHELPPS